VRFNSKTEKPKNLKLKNTRDFFYILLFRGFSVLLLNPNKKIPPDIAAGEDIPKTDYIFMNAVCGKSCGAGMQNTEPNFKTSYSNSQQSGKVASKNLRRGEASRLNGVHGIKTCCFRKAIKWHKSRPKALLANTRRRVI
jgi:hypothetical protein